MALSNRAQLHMLSHEHDRCVALGGRAIDIARRIGSIEVLSHALNNVGSAQTDSGDQSGRRLQEESLTLALDHNLHEHAARAFTNLSSCSIRGRDYDYARRWLDTGINYSIERDLESWRLYMLAWRARLLTETGRWPEAAADCATVMSSARVTPVARIPALTALGLVRARQGALDARQLLDEALALALPTAESQRLVPVRAARAELALLQGQPDLAREETEAGLALLSRTELSWDWDILRYLKWRADGAVSLLRPGSGLLGVASGPYIVTMRGDWRAAAAAWQRIGCPYERAEALADGDVPAMEEALQTFVALGATPAADRVRQGLRRLGVTRLRRGPRSSTRAHPAGPTRRESEILSLLARRMSNPVIGERLFVSPKTVEHHVSAILGKLEVATRDQAVVEARRRGWLSDSANAHAK
jgi:DNA-binding CsgD family transcriptional regulator